MKTIHYSCDDVACQKCVDLKSIGRWFFCSDHFPTYYKKYESIYNQISERFFFEYSYIPKVKIIGPTPRFEKYFFKHHNIPIDYSTFNIYLCKKFPLNVDENWIFLVDSFSIPESAFLALSVLHDSKKEIFSFYLKLLIKEKIDFSLKSLGVEWGAMFAP